MQARILVDGRIEKTNDVAAVKRAHAEQKRLWVDLEERTPEGESLLADTFKLHPLVVEDIWLDRSVPKIEDFDEYVYLVVHGIRRGGTPSRVDLIVLDIVFGPTFVITQHRNIPSTAKIQERLERMPSLLAKGTPWLVHALVDHLVDQYLGLIEELAKKADELEVDVLKKAGMREDHGVLPQIHEVKRSVQALYRVSTYQREVLSRLAHGAYDAIPKDALPYYRDVHDHFVRVADRVEEYRDVVADTMDAFLSMQGNRMNATMKTLATISTIMLPLSFIASVYGMNFRHMPEINWEYGYPYALALMVVVATSLVFWFRYKRWL